MTSYEINLKEKKYQEDFSPLVRGCSCYCCKNHTRAYVHHLLVTNELLAGVLLMMHNFEHYFGFFHSIREALKSDRLAQLKELIRRQASWDVAVWLFTSSLYHGCDVGRRQPEVIITLNFNHLVLRLKSAQSRNICTELCPHEAKETSYDWNDLDWSEEIKTWPFIFLQIEICLVKDKKL